jgi:hypothetical protein
MSLFVPPLSDTYYPAPVPLWARIELTKLAMMQHYWYRYPDENQSDSIGNRIKERLDKLGGGNGRAVYELPPDMTLDDNRYVAKLVQRREITEDQGFLQNWREILITRSGLIDEYIVPVIDHCPCGFWLVMPYAEQSHLEWNQDFIDSAVDDIQSTEGLEAVAKGTFSSSPDISWSENWGQYCGEYRLLDYGGVAIRADVPQYEHELPFVEPVSKNG